MKMSKYFNTDMQQWAIDTGQGFKSQHSFTTIQNCFSAHFVSQHPIQRKRLQWLQGEVFSRHRCRAATECDCGGSEENHDQDGDAREPNIKAPSEGRPCFTAKPSNQAAIWNRLRQSNATNAFNNATQLVSSNIVNTTDKCKNVNTLYFNKSKGFRSLWLLRTGENFG